MLNYAPSWSVKTACGLAKLRTRYRKEAAVFTVVLNIYFFRRSVPCLDWPSDERYTTQNVNRGLQVLSVQFRFAFFKPYSSQTRFLNRPVTAPAEVAHFCRYKKNIFRPICVFKGVYKRQYYCLQYPPFKTQIGRKIKFFVATEVRYFGGRRNWTV